LYQQHLENILTYMHEKYPEELDKSRRWFFEQTGEVYEGDEFFEERISNQLDWFAFDWRNDATEIPIRTYINEKSWSLTPEDVESLEKMCNPVHSIFEVKKINPKKNLLVLFDLIARRKYEVFERRALHGIEKKNIFEARLIPSGEQYIMMNALSPSPLRVSWGRLSWISNILLLTMVQQTRHRKSWIPMRALIPESGSSPKITQDRPRPRTRASDWPAANTSSCRIPMTSLSLIVFPNSSLHLRGPQQMLLLPTTRLSLKMIL